MSTGPAILATLARWCEAGWLRRLDLALARFLHEADPGIPESLLLAAALVAQLESRGHSGLPLARLPTEAAALLDWPAEAAAPLHAAFADWPGDPVALRSAWAGSSVLACDPVDGQGATPLVLGGDLLCLRRYWRYESGVARQVLARCRAPAQAPVDEAAARALLDRLFPAAEPGGVDPGAVGPGSVDPGAVAPGSVDPGAVAPGSVDWQKTACALALRGPLTLITGGPGTGKTFTAARLLVLLQSLHAGPQPMRVALAAPTGKAAARLRQSIVQALHGLGEGPLPAADAARWAAELPPARTLHALLGSQPGTRRFRHDAGQPLALDLLFVDEASMVHLELMAQLLDALPPSARLVLLGDKDQLASVEAGAVLGELCQGAGSGGSAGGYRPETVDWVQRLTGQALPPALQGDGPALAQQTVVLRKSHRFEGPIGRLAEAVNRGDAAAAQAVLASDVSGSLAGVNAPGPDAVLPLALQGRPGAPGGYQPYLARLAARPAEADTPAGFHPWARGVLQAFDGFRVLCALREGPWGVAGLNAAIERALAEAGLLPRRGAAGGGEWYEGRPVMVTRNNPALGVFNGDIGIVLRPPGDGAALRCHFLEGEALRSVAVSRLADVETAFAMTVHKSQGSEFEHVLLVLPDDDVPVLTRELVYTGITRARRAFTLLADRPARLATATARLTRRVSGLRRLLGEPGGLNRA